MTDFEWKEKTKNIDWSNLFGVSIKGVRSRPIISIKCVECNKRYDSKRLRGKWTGEIIVNDIDINGVRHNIVEHPYICLRCRKQPAAIS